MNNYAPTGLNSWSLTSKASRIARKLPGSIRSALAGSRLVTDSDRSSPDGSADEGAPAPEFEGVESEPEISSALRAIVAGGPGGETLTDFQVELLRVIGTLATDPHERAGPADVLEEIERRYGARIPAWALAPALNDLYDQEAIRVSGQGTGAELREADRLYSQRMFPDDEEFALTVWGCDLLQGATTRSARRVGFETVIPDHAPPGAGAGVGSRQGYITQTQTETESGPGDDAGFGSDASAGGEDR